MDLETLQRLAGIALDENKNLREEAASWVSLFQFDVHVYVVQPDGTRTHDNSYTAVWPQIADTMVIIRREMDHLARTNPEGEVVFVIHAHPYEK